MNEITLKTIFAFTCLWHLEPLRITYDVIHLRNYVYFYKQGNLRKISFVSKLLLAKIMVRNILVILISDLQ